jgi:UDP-N-acetylglucosamine 2-epimerase
VEIISAMDYPGFLARASKAAFLLTDSGGLQEEGTVLGVPVVVVRRKTERPEAIEAGCSRLAGVEPDGIVAETLRMADAVENILERQTSEVFGDGRAAERIADVIESRMSNIVSDQ